LIAVTVEDSCDQQFRVVAIVDDLVLDDEGPNTVAELGSDAAHSRLLGQPLELANHHVDEAVGGLASSAT
jgi:hypothetical protein